MATPVINPPALREIRRIRGLTISALAKKAGTRQPHLSNIEKNRRGASVDLIEKLAVALEVDAEALVAVTDTDVLKARRRTAKKVKA